MIEHSKISVIIPVYRAELYLKRCIDSIMKQTYTNLEIILVDDGSPDRCGEICNEYQKKDPRVRVFHTENHGAYQARNTALDAVTGDYISFIDADDWIDSRMYEQLLDALTKYDADIAQCEMNNDGAYAQIRSKAMGKDVVYHAEELSAAMFREEITHGLTNKLFRREIWKTMRFSGDLVHLDAVTMSQVERFCTTFVRIDAILYFYNTENISITRSRKTMLHLKSMENLFDAYVEAAEKAGNDGTFFICREIPSGGRLIAPSAAVSCAQVSQHIRYMHRIFCKCWASAKTSQAYHSASVWKRLLWHIYSVLPVTASALTYLHLCTKKRRK